MLGMYFYPGANMTPIEISKTGTHTANNGIVVNFSDADFNASVAAYDSKVHQAPLVVGHPTLEAPAYGWINSMSFSDGILKASPEQVNADFSEMVNGGSFKKVSASFFTPNSPNNPVPGVYYLRHVGFLGATAPAIKGLKDVSFADDSDVLTIEFSEAAKDGGHASNAGAVASEAAKDGGHASNAGAVASEAAKDGGHASNTPRVLPSGRAGAVASDTAATDTSDKSAVGILQAIINLVTPNKPTLDFADVTANDHSNNPTHINKEIKMPDANAQTVDFAEQQKQLDKQIADNDARELKLKQHEQKIMRQGHVDFAESLVTAGKVLPVDKDNLVDFMQSLPTENSIDFADGDNTQKQTSIDWFKGYMQKQPVQIDFSEHSAESNGDAKTLDFSAPADCDIDVDRNELHQKALAYQKDNNVNYAAAVSAVS